MAKFREYLESKDTSVLLEMDKAYSKGSSDDITQRVKDLDKYRHKLVRQELKKRTKNATKD